MATLPTGVVSFLLTDVVGSTELWERAPDAMTVALARHDELVSTAVQREGGTVLKSRGEGDSTFSVFTRASGALRAAHRLQASVGAETWPSEAVIRTRAAVHTGEAVERDGDYFGPAVNRVARLRGVASGGEVVVSATTAAIVATALPAAWELVDIGMVELKGVGPQQAFLLAAPGLDPVRPRRAAPEGGSSPREAEILELMVESRAVLPAALELLADAGGFVGRKAERDVLRNRWQMAAAGHTLMVVVAAEAGMGKSRLVSEVAAEVHADGGRVLFGACYEDVEQPYGPFIQGIADADDGAPGGLTSELARLLPGAAPVVAPAADDVSAPAAVIHGIRHWLTTAASVAPILLVIEDLHWSTSTTRDVVRDLVRTAGRARLLVIITTRDSAPDVDEDLASLLADLERSPAVFRLRLRGLDRDEVAELVGIATDEAGAIVAHTGGNPLLVTHMTADGRPGSLPALLARRDARLDEPARALVDLAATFGAEFDANLLSAGSATPLLAVLESLEAAETAGLITPLPGRPGRFAFVHALFRSHRYEALPMRRRLDLHAAAARALGTTHGAGQLSARARHACLSVPVGDARNAVELAHEAAHEAEHAYAYEEAVTHYERALLAARSLDPPDAQTTRDLTVRLAAALVRHGDPRGVPLLIDVAEQARGAADDAALVRAASSLSHFGATGAFVGPDPAPLGVVEAALAVVGTEPTPMRARLLIEKACQIGAVRVDESIELAEEAEAVARHLGDDDVLGHVLLGARLVGRHPSRLAVHEHIGVELERLGEMLPARALKLAGLTSRACVHLERGELGSWVDLVDRAADLLGDLSLPFFQLDVLSYRAMRAFLDGDLQGAEDVAVSMTPLAIAIRHPPHAWSGPIVYANRRLQDGDAELITTIEAITRGGGDVAVYRCCLAAALARAGRVDDARHVLDAVRADGYRVSRNMTWTYSMSELAEAAEVAGDRETAGHVLDEAGDYAGYFANTGAHVMRPIDQVLAQAALGVGEVAAAVTHAERAVAASRRNGTPTFLARELVFLAEARRRDGGSRADVLPLVREALAVAEPIGARIVEVDVARYGLPT